MDLWQRLHRSHLERLSELRKDLSVSLYLPTGERDSDWQTSQLARLLGDAELLLARQGVPPAEIRQLLEPGRELLEELPFWTCALHQSAAIFLSTGGCHFLRSPYPVERPTLRVGREPYVLPLAAIQQEDLRFHVLHLASERFRLFKGDLYHLREIEWQELPPALGRSLAHPEQDLRSLSQALSRYLPERPPLLLAGSQALRTSYRQQSGNLQLLELPRSEDEMQGFYERSWACLRAWLGRLRGQALTQAGRDNPTELLTLAQEGRLEVLLVPAGTEDELDELVNRIALTVVAHSGQVMVGASAELGRVAAVERAPVAAR